VQRVKVVQDGYSADLLCPEDIEVDYQAGTKKIEVRSNVDFKVSKSQGDWLTVSKSGYNISFTYSANQSEEPREAVITIANEEYKISEQFLFIQGGAPQSGGDEPFDAELICPEDIEVDYQAGTKSIQVRSNVDFNVSVSQNSWLTVSKSGKDLRFTYQENGSTESRSANVTLTNSEYNISEQFLFIQGGAPQGGGSQGGGDNVVMWRDWAELPVCNEREGFDYVVHGGITVGGKSNQRNFTICFDREHKLATWVAYPLHKSHIGSSGRTEDWQYGPGVPTQYQPNLSKSYTGNYDRGHQIPSGDRTGSKEMNRPTFYYSNMTPQASQFNQGGWATLENDVRSEICSDTLYVVTGALFLTTNDSSIAKQTTDKSGKTCPIPSHYYKVLLRTKSGNTGKAIKNITNASEIKAIAILIKHKSTCNIQNSDYISIKELERQSGYTFFPALNDAIEDEVKQQCNPSAWF
jgi:endonuclease G